MYVIVYSSASFLYRHKSIISQREIRKSNRVRFTLSVSWAFEAARFCTKATWRDVPDLSQAWLLAACVGRVHWVHWSSGRSFFQVQLCISRLLAVSFWKLAQLMPKIMALRQLRAQSWKWPRNNMEPPYQVDFKLTSLCSPLSASILSARP